MIRILIADGHKKFSEALCKILSTDPLLEVVGISSSSAAAVPMARTEHADIIFIDSNGHPLESVEATKKILAGTHAKVIALSTYTDPIYAGNMLMAGARGYITKNSPAAEIIEAVKEVAAGHLYLCNESKGLVKPVLIPVAPQRKPMRVIRDTTRDLIKTVEMHWHHIFKIAN